MYLSRLVLNPINRYVQHDLADIYQLHRTILSGFPQAVKGDQKARDAFEILFRLDRNEKSDHLILLIQSGQQPNWVTLPQGYLREEIDESPNPAVKSIDQSLEKLQKNMLLSFRLRANPTKKLNEVLKTDRIEKKLKANGKRIPLLKSTQQIQWLEKKAQQGGFQIRSVITNPEQKLLGYKPSPKSKMTPAREAPKIIRASQANLTFEAVVFSGTLKITDIAKFKHIFRKGIGSGKAFGFGMLSIAPI